jgi:hypothetical protein
MLDLLRGRIVVDRDRWDIGFSDRRLMGKNAGHRMFCRFGGRTFRRMKVLRVGFESFQMNCGGSYMMQEMSTSTWGIIRESGRVLCDEGRRIAANCLAWGRKSGTALHVSHFLFWKICSPYHNFLSNHILSLI